MATHIESLEELPSLVGTELGVTEWTKVTQEQVDRFADATGDHQWIHTDPERAASGPFGGTIAHGFLTLSPTPKVVADVLQIGDMQAALNYGLKEGPVPGTSAGRIQCPCRGGNCLRAAEAFGNRGRFQCSFRI
jgi:acyl dehydratase